MGMIYYERALILQYISHAQFNPLTSKHSRLWLHSYVLLIAYLKPGY